MVRSTALVLVKIMTEANVGALIEGGIPADRIRLICTNKLPLMAVCLLYLRH